MMDRTSLDLWTYVDRAAARAVERAGTRLFLGQVTAIDGQRRVQIRRPWNTTADGPYYPRLNTYWPQVGDWVVCLETMGGVVVLGRQIVTGDQGSVPYLIARADLASAASFIDFQNIPASFEHVRILFHGRGTTTAAIASMVMRLNGDSGANYDHSLIRSQGGAISGTEGFGTSFIQIGAIPGTGSSSPDLVGAITIDVPGYRKSRHKVAIASANYKTSTNSGGIVTEVWTGQWRNTAAINRIQLIPTSGQLDVGTVCSLYGIP